MKKIFTLIAAALFCGSAWAEVVFTDADGKTYEDGQTMTIHSYDDEGDVMMPCPVLKNTGSAAATVQLSCTIKSMPEGTKFNECFSGGCTSYTSGSFTTSQKSLAAGKEMETLIEWSTWNNASKTNIEGTAKLEMTLKASGQSDKTITIEFVHGEATGISSLSAKANCKSSKTIQNGKLCIVRNGICYDAEGKRHQ